MQCGEKDFRGTFVFNDGILPVNRVTTFPQSRKQLKEHDDLRQRFGMLIILACEACAYSVSFFIRIGAAIGSHSGLENNETKAAEVSNRIWTQAWPHMICTTCVPDEYTNWIALDEVGCAFGHSRYPNMEICPIILITEKTPGVFSRQTLTLAWPVQNILIGEELTRDYLSGLNTAPRDAEIANTEGVGKYDDWGRVAGEPTAVLTRELLSCGLIPPPASVIKSRRLDAPVVVTTESTNWRIKVDAVLQSVVRDPALTADMPSSSRHVVMSRLLPSSPLPEWEASLQKLRRIADTPSERLRVYVDRKEYLYGHLEQPDDTAKIILVSDPSEADVLYLIDHTYTTSVDGTPAECELYKTGKILNQFWWEGLLVTKQMLTRTINRAYDVYGVSKDSSLGTVNSVMNHSRLPSWFVESYDLSVPFELWSFIKSYRDR